MYNIFCLDKPHLRKSFVFIFDNKIDGIDRIVPIGQALDIDFYWDGYDINKILSRIVDVR